MCASKKKGELFNVKRVKKGGFNQMVVQKEEEEGVTTLLGNSQDKETRYIPHGNQQYKTEDVQNLGSLKKGLTIYIVQTLREMLIKYTLRNK